MYHLHLAASHLADDVNSFLVSRLLLRFGRLPGRVCFSVCFVLLVVGLFRCSPCRFRLLGSSYSIVLQVTCRFVVILPGQLHIWGAISNFDWKAGRADEGKRSVRSPKDRTKYGRSHEAVDDYRSAPKLRCANMLRPSLPLSTG